MPILVPKEFAYNIWKRLPPDVEGKVGLGWNRRGPGRGHGSEGLHLYEYVGVCVVLYVASYNNF